MFSPTSSKLPCSTLFRAGNERESLNSRSKRLYALSRLVRARLIKLTRLARNRSYWPALRVGVAASVEHARIPFGEEFATVIDVGASRGQFALFSRANFPAAAIICFEPQPGPAADLRRVLGDDVALIQSALGPEPGKSRMNISARDDSSSLLAIGRKQVEEFPGTQADHTIEVDVVRLDDAIPRPIARPSLLKIDVQGFELEALRGGPEVLREIDVALIECSFVQLYEGQPLADEIVNFMFEAGLRLRGVHGMAYSSDGSAIQADLLFVRGLDTLTTATVVDPIPMTVSEALSRVVFSRSENERQRAGGGVGEMLGIPPACRNNPGPRACDVPQRRASSRLDLPRRCFARTPVLFRISRLADRSAGVRRVN